MAMKMEKGLISKDCLFDDEEERFLSHLLKDDRLDLMEDWGNGQPERKMLEGLEPQWICKKCKMSNTQLS